jgi:YVTN family beta-propeller protein
MGRHVRFTRLRGVLIFLAALGASGAARGAAANSLMDLSADGKLLACANRDSGSVSVIDVASREKVRELAVGKKPEGVAFLGDSHQLAVVVYGDARVVFVDADAGTVAGSVEVFAEPYGVVAGPDGRTAYVTLEYPGEVAEIDVPGRTVRRTLKAGDFLRGIALAPRDRRLYVTEYLTGTVKAIDLAAWRVADSWPGIRSDNLARQIVLHPSRSKAYLPHVRSRVNTPEGTGSIFPFVTVLDTAPGEGRRRNSLPMDSFGGTVVVANPWETAVSPDGKRLYAVFSGTDDLYACEVLDDNYRELQRQGIVRLGRNPRAVRVAPDSQTFFVYNALDFTVTAHDALSLRTLATIPVCANPLSKEVHRGKVLFYSALQPMVGRRWISCASCHPDGDADGRTWHNAEGLRNTPALAGLAWTHPLHWSADRDETQDFEHTIRGPLMQGRGLAPRPPFPPLGEPNKGLSEDLDALAAYTNSHPVPLSPHAKGGLSAAARRGKDVFFSAETRCATCHGGPLYTDSRAERPFKLHDVGTGGDDPSEKLGPDYDTPTLLGVYRTAPYLHHGKAKTLMEVLTTFNPGDRHGKTSHLSRQGLDDLVEFLKALPYEDPEPAAKAAKLPKVER